MSKSKRFAYVPLSSDASPDSILPLLPMTLSRGTKTSQVLGLVDSGATVNVLPYGIGLEIGAVWEEQMPLFRLSGNLGNYESRGLIVNAEIEDLEPVKLAFAWTMAEDVPVILGQTNFFSLFDVCFMRQDREFEIKMH
ncbi:MAG: retroviral-like aspartic protease [Pyrinomonadaceae bacterium]